MTGTAEKRINHSYSPGKVDGFKDSGARRLSPVKYLQKNDSNSPRKLEFNI